MDSVAILENEVRELIRRRGLDPVRDHQGIRDLVSDVVADYDERSLLGAVPPLTDAVAAMKAVVDAVAGLGPLQKYLEDDDIEEIWINSRAVGICAGESITAPPQSAGGPHETPRTDRPQPGESGPRPWATGASRC